jgi:zinc protease
MKVMQPDWAAGLEILGDVLANPVFPETAVAREKEAQLAGLKAEEEEMTTVARNLLRRTLFAGHPYGMRGGGSPETLAGIDRAQLAAFQRRFVVGRNGVLAVFGNVKAAEVKALVEKTLGILPAGSPGIENPPLPTPLTGTQSVEEPKEKAQAIVMVGFRGADLFSSDRYALELIDEASSDLGSRFFIRIRENLGLAYFVGSSQATGLVPGPFVFYLGTSPSKVEAVKAEFLDEIRQLAEHGLTPTELHRAKEKLLGQQVIHNQSNDAFAYACALDELFGVGYDHYKRLREHIEAVTLEEVQAVARKYFAGTPSVLAVVRPAPEA